MCTSTVARRIWVAAAGASSDCALVVPCAFWYMVVTFRGRRKGNLVPIVGASKSTFRDRRKGSELFYFEVQFSRQAQHFGHGGDRGGAQIS